MTSIFGVSFSLLTVFVVVTAFGIECGLAAFHPMLAIAWAPSIAWTTFLIVFVDVLRVHKSSRRTND